MEDIVVRYKWDNDKKSGDLVCEVTEFMDKYLLWGNKSTYMNTYLYNDLEIFSTNSLLQIAFRYPGATRGGILLKRLDKNRFEIIGFNFNVNECFGEFAIYDDKLKSDIDIYIGRILNFTEVTLMNNLPMFKN